MSDRMTFVPVMSAMLVTPLCAVIWGVPHQPVPELTIAGAIFLVIPAILGIVCFVAWIFYIFTELKTLDQRISFTFPGLLFMAVAFIPLGILINVSIPSSSLNSADSKVQSAMQAKDFDSARIPLKEFLVKFQGKDEFTVKATASLKAVEDESDKEFAKVKAEASGLMAENKKSITSALAVWDAYLKLVKDEKHKQEATQARAELKDRPTQK